MCMYSEQNSTGVGWKLKNAIWRILKSLDFRFLAKFSTLLGCMYYSIVLSNKNYSFLATKKFFKLNIWVFFLLLYYYVFLPHNSL